MSKRVKAVIENEGASLRVVWTKPCSSSRYCTILGL